MAYSYGRSFDDKYYDGNRKEDLRNTKDLRRSQGNPLRETHLSGLAASRGKDHGDKLRESRIPDYLEFDVFGYLDDYDDAGYDRKKPGNPHNRTQTENPYGWDALGQTGKPPVEGDALRSSRAHVLRETNVAGVPRIGEGEDPYARGLTTEQSRAITFRNTVQEYGEGPGQNSNGQTAIGRTRLQSEKDENPYGHRVLGRTVPSSSYKSTSDVTSDTQDTIQVRSTSQHLGTSGYSPNAFGKQEPPGYGRGNVTDLRSTNIKSTEDQPYRKTNDYPLVSDVARRLDSDIKAQKHWTSMALDFGLRNSWYSLFGKIRKKWAAGYASTDMATTATFVKDNGSDGDSSKDENVWLSNFRLRIIIVVAMVLVTISVAIIVPVALFAGKDERTESFRMYDFEAVFINRNFTNDMLSPTSKSFKTLNYTLCSQLLENGKAKSDNYQYRQCLVLNIRQGSIIVQFRIVVSTTVKDFPTDDTVLSELGLRPVSDTVKIGEFIVNKTISFKNSSNINSLNSAFLKGIQYNASCNGVVDQCTTNYSACINKTCQCIENYWHNDAACLSSNISFSENRKLLLVGGRDSLTCTLSNAPGWKNVVFGKINNGSQDELIPILVLTNATGQPNTTTNETDMTNVTYRVQSDGVTIVLTFENVSCENKGQYKCLHVVSNMTLTISSLQPDSLRTGRGTISDIAYVDIYDNTTTLVLIVPENVTDHTVTAVCSGIVGRGAANSSQMIDIMISYNSSTEVYKLAVIDIKNTSDSYEDSCYINITKTTVFTLSGTGSMNIECHLKLPNGIVKTETDTVNILQGTESFRMYDLEAVFINRNFTNDMLSSTSESFKTLNDLFCTQLLENGKDKSVDYVYRHCFVLNIRSGSIKVRFRIVVSTTVNHFPKNNTVLSELGLRSDSETIAVGNFIVNYTISFKNSTNIDSLNSSFLKGIHYNASCNGVVDQCITNYSACINDTCQCIENYWYNGAVCLPITCSAALNISNGTITSSKNRVGDVLEVKCFEGFTLTTNVSVCMPNGNWNVRPKCRPIPCPTYVLPAHVRQPVSLNGTFGEKIEIECELGYALKGNKTVQCLATGNWGTSPECVNVTCGDYSIPNNSHIVNKTGDNYNDSFIFECDDGYDPKRSVIFCMANESWSEYPMCTIKDCGNISEENLNVTYPNTSTTFGSIAFINCTNGFDRIGPTSVACLASGEWEQLPSCVNKTSCGDFSPPPHSSINMSSAENMTLVCDPGYKLKGTPLVQCVNNTRINGSCQPVCINFNLSENTISSSYNNMTIYSAGESVNVSCKPGFGTTDNQTVICQDSGNWTKVPVCKQTHCFEKDLPKNVNSSISSNLYKLNETIIIECLPGFVNNGETKTTCMPDGKWSNFSACEEVTCSLANISEHFTLNQTSREKSYGVNDSVSLACYPGFNVNGNELVTINCTIHGNWSEPVDCQLVTCGGYKLPNNSVFVNSTLANRATYDFNTTIDIMCEQGYALVNNDQNYVTCGVDGEWEGTPTCKIPGNISFSRNRNLFLVGGRDNLTCTLVDAPGWKNVVFGKINNGSQDELSPILVLTNANGQPNATTNEADMAQVTYSVESDSVTIVLTFKNVSCENTGQYKCVQVVSNMTLTINSLKPDFLRTGRGTISDIAYVDIYDNTTTLVLIVPQNVTDHTVTAVCIGIVGRGAANNSQMIDIMISYNSRTELDKLAVIDIKNTSDSYEDSCYINITKTTVFTLNGTGSMHIECHLKLPNGIVKTETDTVNILQENKTLGIFDLEFVILNDNFAAEMQSPTSDIFKRLENETCNQVLEYGRASSDNYTYEQCYLLEIRNGSLIVVLRIILSVTKMELPNSDILLTDLGLTSDSGANNVTLGRYHLSANITVLRNTQIDSVDLNEKELGTDCNSTFDRCVTSYSACINGTCQCIMTHFYNGSTCLPITCPVPDVTDGNVYTSGIHFKDTLSVSCKDGFQLIPANFTQLICTKNGTWGTLPNCSEVVCKEFQVPRNASVNGNTTGRVFKDIITVSCDEGFKVDGNGTSLCQSDGNWSMTPSCNPVQCPEFQKPANAYLEPSVTQNLTYKEEIRVNCEDGYKIDGSSNNTTCQANGAWSSYPSCKLINCSGPDLPSRLNVITHNISYLFESQVELKCDSGYNLVGNTTIHCMADGNWSLFPVCEPTVCHTQNLSDHIILPDVLNRTFGNLVEIECEVGYTIDGNKTIVCLETGFWSESPECEPIECKEFYGQKNMNLNYSNGTTFNETVTVTCFDGYKLIGENVLRCTEFGNWSGTAVCEQKICLAPNASDYPFITPFQNKTFEVGSEITVTCKEGYAPTTNVTVTCFDNETWSNFPSCDPVDCGDPMQIDYAENFTVNNTIFNSSFEVTCTDGFERKGNKTVTCQATGSWSDYPKCNQTHCFGKDLPAAINSSKTLYEINENVSMQCSPGFVNKGDNQTTCMPGGKWSSVSPCEAVTCSLANFSEHFDFDQEKRATPYSVDESISLKCFAGYELLGGKKINCTIYGNWSETVDCIEATCGNYTLPDRAMFTNQTEASNAPFDFNTTLEITCEPGYVLVNDFEDYVTCETDGTWQGAPKCDLQGTISFSAPRSQFRIGERANITCTLSNAPYWKSVIVGLQTTQDNMDPVYIVTNVGGNMSADKTRTNTVDVTYQNHTDGITITVIFDPASCNSTGNYVCAHVGIDKTLTIDNINYATLSGSNGKVNVTYLQTYDLQLPVPKNVTGRNVTAVCSGVVGIDAENSTQKVNVSFPNPTTTLQLVDSNVVSSYNSHDSCYTVTKSATFTFTGNETLVINCLMMLGSEETKTESVTVDIGEG